MGLVGKWQTYQLWQDSGEYCADRTVSTAKICSSRIWQAFIGVRTTRDTCVLCVFTHYLNQSMCLWLFVYDVCVWKRLSTSMLFWITLSNRQELCYVCIMTYTRCVYMYIYLYICIYLYMYSWIRAVTTRLWLKVISKCSKESTNAHVGRKYKDVERKRLTEKCRTSGKERIRYTPKPYNALSIHMHVQHIVYWHARIFVGVHSCMLLLSLREK